MFSRRSAKIQKKKPETVICWPYARCSCGLPSAWIKNRIVEIAFIYVFFFFHFQTLIVDSNVNSVVMVRFMVFINWCICELKQSISHLSISDRMPTWWLNGTLQFILSLSHTRVIVAVVVARFDFGLGTHTIDNSWNEAYNRVGVFVATIDGH